MGDSDSLPFATLAAVADGLPRSLPFHAVKVRFGGKAFGNGTPLITTGVGASDNWWVNGRNRHLSAGFIQEVVGSAKVLPPPAGPLGALLAALGKPSKTNRFPLVDFHPGQKPNAALDAIGQKYRGLLRELVESAGMPHSLPPVAEVLMLPRPPHPLKPALESAFKALGYSCKGGSGTFSLTTPDRGQQHSGGRPRRGHLEPVGDRPFSRAHAGIPADSWDARRARTGRSAISHRR